MLFVFLIFLFLLLCTEPQSVSAQTEVGRGFVTEDSTGITNNLLVNDFENPRQIVNAFSNNNFIPDGRAFSNENLILKTAYYPNDNLNSSNGTVGCDDRSYLQTDPNYPAGSVAFSNENGLEAVPGNDWESHNVEKWTWQVLPTGSMYPSYLAGRKEPRLGCVFTKDPDYGMLWDIELGGRMPLLRYGTSGAVLPEGWQVEIEGAALLRLDFERDRELAGTDYRAGILLAYSTGHWQFKVANYHVSSHLGDNYILKSFRLPRINYVRDEIVLGAAWRPIQEIRLYGEVGVAYHTGTTTDPLEIQFGAEYSAPYRKGQNFIGSPFAAINGHLFQELDYGGYVNMQAGWQWRGQSNSLLRLGIEFFNGCDDQYQFHFNYQRKVGFLIALDF